MAKVASAPRVSISPQMKAAWSLYESGNVVSARRQAESILSSPSSPGDADQAKDLIARTQIPRSGLLFAAVAAGLILLMILLAVLRG